MSSDRDEEEREDGDVARHLVFEPRATAATHVPPTGEASDHTAASRPTKTTREAVTRPFRAIESVKIRRH